MIKCKTQTIFSTTTLHTVIEYHNRGHNAIRNPVIDRRNKTLEFPDARDFGKVEGVIKGKCLKRVNKWRYLPRFLSNYFHIGMFVVI